MLKKKPAVQLQMKLWGKFELKVVLSSKANKNVKLTSLGCVFELFSTTSQDVTGNSNIQM